MVGLSACQHNNGICRSRIIPLRDEEAQSFEVEMQALQCAVELLEGMRGEYVRDTVHVSAAKHAR